LEKFNFKDSSVFTVLIRGFVVVIKSFKKVGVVTFDITIYMLKVLKIVADSSRL
jgi:hypothetical protein